MVLTGRLTLQYSCVVDIELDLFRKVEYSGVLRAGKSEFGSLIWIRF